VEDVGQDDSSGGASGEGWVEDSSRENLLAAQVGEVLEFQKLIHC
jgi:hypothetical protein